jgi:DNA invertase Pin-like site-specific DNA recombinase
VAAQVSHPPATTVPAGQPPQQLDPARVPTRTVVCYLRSANPGSVGQRLLGRQRTRLQAACVANGWTVIEWVEDLHQSGATLDRPGLRHALALLATQQADTLLACDHSRLAVDTMVGSELAALARRQGWQLLTLSPGRGGPHR